MFTMPKGFSNPFLFDYKLQTVTLVCLYFSFDTPPTFLFECWVVPKIARQGSVGMLGVPCLNPNPFIRAA